jgi:2-polyprenyl-6-methoxyphenol hydroxylase-like FAD-dependent oxidoreductase
MEFLVVGAGIGGLTAALKLHQLGLNVTVAEAATDMRPLGVGINLLPHGVAVLSELGLEDRLAATGIETRAIEYRTKYGQLILSDPRGRDAGFPWPQYSIHRGHLQMILLEAARERIGSERIKTGLEFQDLDREAHGIIAHFRRRPGGGVESLRADALIGADGIRSRVCEVLVPAAPPLLFSGVMLYRGAVERDPFLDGRTMIIAGHHDCKAVIYPVSHEAANRGRSLVNWVAEIRVGKDKRYEREDWNRRASAEEFAAHYQDWKLGFIDVTALFRSTPQIYVFPMIDRDPLPHWSFGRVTLLGDAAHPMYPIGANGASQAILDAEVLAHALAESNGNIEDAMSAYEARRLAPTAQVVLSNRAKGPERVLQLANERIRGPEDRIAEIITREELDAITQDYQRLSGFDLETLRKRGANSKRFEFAAAKKLPEQK